MVYVLPLKQSGIVIFFYYEPQIRNRPQKMTQKSKKVAALTKEGAT